MLPLIGSRSALFLGGPNPDSAVSALQSATLRIVGTFPAGAYKLTLIDARGVGERLKPFLRLPAGVRHDKVYSAPGEIEAEVARLLRHIENVTQTRLLNHSSIEAFNASVGDISIPYEFLVVAGFPAGFTDTAAATVISIARNGARTGTFILASTDSRAAVPSGLDPNEIASLCTVIQLGQSGAKWNNPTFGAFPLALDSFPGLDVVNRIIDRAANQPDDGAAVVFSKIAVPAAMRWKTSSAKGLEAPVGIGESGGLHLFQLGEFGTGLVNNGLISGLPGSGKTNLLHALILQLALAYAPEELELYLVDLKEGVEFQEYATLGLPHARVVALEADPEFALSVLQALQREMTRRVELFRSANVKNISQYRSSVPDPMPRILLVMDEYQRLFGEDGALATSANTALADLVRTGRVFGIHMLLSSQTPASSLTSDRTAMNMIRLRVCLKSSDDDARLVLGDASADIGRLEHPGEALWNADGGGGKNVFVQIARLDQDERQALLAELAAAARPDRMSHVVFDASRPAEIAQNAAFRDALAATTNDGADFHLWVGAAIGVAPDTSAILARRSHSNMLMVGPNEDEARSILVSTLIGLCAQSNSDALQFYVLRLGPHQDRWDEAWRALAPLLGPSLHIVDHDAAPEFLTRLAEILDARKASADEESRVVLVVPGLDRFETLLETDDYDDPAAGAKEFTRLLAMGPAVGIHVLAWASAFAPIEQAIRRRGASSFGIRVALQIDEDESNAFLGSPIARRLAPNRAYLKDTTRGGEVTTKFKPYSTPSDADMASIQLSLAARAPGRANVVWAAAGAAGESQEGSSR